MVSEINLEQLRQEIKDLEIDIMIKERKVKELKKIPWYITLISWVIGFASFFFLLIPAGAAFYQQNWVAGIIALAIFVIIIVAWVVFLNNTEHGRKYKKALQTLEQTKKKKKNN